MGKLEVEEEESPGEVGRDEESSRRVVSKYEEVYEYRG